MTTPSEPLAGLMAELQALLEEERDVLLAGNPELITAVAQRKLILGDRIEKETAVPGAPLPSVEMLTALARYNRQNAVICSAMLRHMTEAIDKLRRHEPHRSYKPDGSETSQPARHTLGAA
jgi:hypothetical protein